MKPVRQYYRLLAEDIPLVMELYRQGIPVAHIAEKFEVSWHCVKGTINREMKKAD